MVFEYLSHDGEPEARALHACRHVRFRKTMAVIVRETDSIVVDPEDRTAVFLPYCYSDSPRLLASLRFACADRLAGVLEHIH